MTLEVRDIAVDVGGCRIFGGIHFELSAGEVMALHGPNGCGKTTLLRAVAGLITVAHGEVSCAGVSINRPGATTGLSPGTVGFAFQDGGLWPHMRVATHLDFVLRAVVKGRAARRARVEETLEQFSLLSVARKRPHQLSGGERQRLSLARAVSVRPRLLLLDEAFVHLDEESRSAAGEAVATLVQNGTAVLAATHEALPFAVGKSYAMTAGGLVPRG